MSPAPPRIRYSRQAKPRRGGSHAWADRTLSTESSWCKSSPANAVAGRPVASLASRRATGGGKRRQRGSEPGPTGGKGGNRLADWSRATCRYTETERPPPDGPYRYLQIENERRWSMQRGARTNACTHESATMGIPGTPGMPVQCVAHCSRDLLAENGSADSAARYPLGTGTEGRAAVTGPPEGDRETWLAPPTFQPVEQSPDGLRLTRARNCG
jgi:hypothetical protein